MNNIKQILLCFLVISSATTSFNSWAKNSDQPDSLALAALLISDGNLHRANTELDKLDPKSDDLDLAQYHLLKGLLAYKSASYDRANGHYLASLQNGQQDKLIYIYLAQSYYALQDYANALLAIADSGEQGKALSSVYSLQAQCHWKLKQYDAAWLALDSGIQQIPNDNRFDRQKIYYLIEKGLYQSAIEIAQPFLETSDGGEKEYIALGRALRGSGQTQLAAQVLEKAKLLFPQSTSVITELAHAYMKQDKLMSASDLFAQAYILQPKLAADASELYRQAGRLYRALNINGEIQDQKAKLKQRLAILVELGDFESVAAMDEALNRLSLYDNQDIRYAHAYALFRTGDFDHAKLQLSQLTRADLFRKASELRKAMDRCKDAAWLCY